MTARAVATRRPLSAACGALLAAWLVMPAAAGGAPLSPQELRGQQIYETGVSPSGAAINGRFGENRLELPGPALTCGSCHGHDGRGRPESGVEPTNVTWRYLTKSYGHLHRGGRTHTAFGVESLKHYLRTGIFPGGGSGDPAMPVFQMADSDLDDLVAYLKRLGATGEPGVGPQRIRLGTLLPRSGAGAETGEAIRRVLEAYFREVNAHGGVYGRRLELVTHAVDPEDPAAVEKIRHWLAREQPFALLGTFTPRLEEQVQALLAEEEIPTVGAVTLHPSEEFSGNRTQFYLLAGLEAQVRALVRYGGEQLGLEEAALTLVYPRSVVVPEVIDAAESAARARGWPVPRRATFDPGAFKAGELVEALRGQGSEALLFLGSGPDLAAFLQAAEAYAWRPRLLVPGVLAGSGALAATPAQGDQTYLAYPTLPQDRNPVAVDELARLMEVDGGKRGAHLQAVITAYCAGEVLVTAMRRAGRALGRRELIAALEGIYHFETGLIPPVTYTSNRRFGTGGSYVVRLGTGRMAPDSVVWVAEE